MLDSFKSKRDNMKRSKYFNYIEEKLITLSTRISMRGKINLLDLHIHSETFFADMLNMLLKLNLSNANAIKHNIEGIDLIDNDNKVIAQVSSVNVKKKIESSLNKDIIRQHSDYRFIFIPIVGDSKNLRKKGFANPYGIKFDPENDIYDIKTILKMVLYMKIGEQQKLYTLIKDELGFEVDLEKVDTNLASIINILAKENLVNISNPLEINAFEIERKIDFNNLQDARDTIDSYKVYYGKLNEKYSEFDKMGSNRSLSIFNFLSKQYRLLRKEKADDTDVFYSVIEKVVETVQNSDNYVEIPYEELELCACIIVVDAFIKCKIFKNPEGYNYVVTG